MIQNYKELKEELRKLFQSNENRYNYRIEEDDNPMILQMNSKECWISVSKQNEGEIYEIRQGREYSFMDSISDPQLVYDYVKILMKLEISRICYN